MKTDLTLEQIESYRENGFLIIEDWLTADELEEWREAVMEAVDIIRDKKDTMLVGSGSIFQSMNSSVTMNLSTIFKLRGVNFTVSAACASGSHSIGLGFQALVSSLVSARVARSS